MNHLFTKLLSKIGMFRMECDEMDWKNPEARVLKVYLASESGKKMLDIFSRNIAERAVFRSQAHSTPWENGFTAGQADVMSRLLALAEIPQTEDEEKTDER